MNRRDALLRMLKGSVAAPLALLAPPPPEEPRGAEVAVAGKNVIIRGGHFAAPLSLVGAESVQISDCTFHTEGAGLRVL